MSAPESTAPNLELDNVVKVYDGLQVLHDICFAVSPGEVVALVGHNGAGKTTIMKSLLGLIRPTSGSVRVLGHDPAGANAAAARLGMGFLPETVSFPANMTGREIMNFYARLKRQDLVDNGRLLEMVGLADASDRRVKTYSKGMRQRLGLAQALIGSPRVLLLDEPTTGLDPSLRRSFYDTIMSLKNDGVTVLLASHALSEMEARVDRIAIMSEGHLMADGTMAQLRKQAGLPARIRLTTDNGEAGRAAEHLQGADIKHVNGRTVEFDCASEDKMDLVRRVTDLGVTIEDLEIELPNLDRIYELYQKPEVLQ
jgi:Cu-processing system ATP-binding protein